MLDHDLHYLQGNEERKVDIRGDTLAAANGNCGLFPGGSGVAIDRVVAQSRGAFLADLAEEAQSHDSGKNCPDE